MFTEYINNH